MSATLIAFVLGSTGAGPASAQTLACVQVQTAMDVVNYLDTHDPVGSNIISTYPILDLSTDPDQLLGLPGQYISKAGFEDYRVNTADAYVEMFASLADRAARLVALQRTVQPISQETYLVTDLVLLRLPAGFTPTAVAEYRGLLRTVCTLP